MPPVPFRVPFRCHVPRADPAKRSMGLEAEGCDNDGTWDAPGTLVEQGPRQASGPYLEVEAPAGACPGCGNPGTAVADVTVFLVPTQDPPPSADDLVERLAQEGSEEQIEAAITRLRKRQEEARRAKRPQGEG